MAASGGSILLSGDADWYKDAIIYELHVRAFRDSDGDGMGDFAGLSQKLDYLQDLGVTAIWVLPFYPSPWRDDGYDISDYTSVHPAYGTLRDFRLFLKEAHRRGLRVITELVLNHTSDQHAWFQRSRRAAPGSHWRDFYVWSDTPDRYSDVRIIFKDFESSNWSWDPVAKAYYWHRFYSHQPDLNFDNPAVQEEMLKVVDTWMRMSVDGLRLDAVPYLYEREGTSCENLSETHAFLRKLREHVDKNFRGRMLLAEANQWPEDAVAYFGSGDECHMAFHFPLMPRLFMAIRMEDSLPIVDTLEHTPEIPEGCQWALFLRNHDELTLEMVTDSERDYMYGAYARDPQARINLGIRRRLAPLLENNRRKIELMNALLLSLPGTPVIYYGDEIGMGDNIYLGDRNAVRTPIHWSADRNAGFSSANPQRLFLPVTIDPEYHYESLNIEAQQNNPHSLLSWVKRVIALRKRYKVFGRGSIQVLHTDNRKVLTFLRRYRGEVIMVVANMSRYSQYVQLDLSSMDGVVPIELFGGTRFPPIGQLPYFLTLGPHSFYWFALEQRAPIAELPKVAHGRGIPVLSVSSSWDEVLQGRAREALEARLPEFLMGSAWFTRKHRTIRTARFSDAIPLEQGGRRFYVALVQLTYAQGEPEVFLVPLSYAVGSKAAALRKNVPAFILARVHVAERDTEGVLYDAAYDGDYAEILLDGIIRKRRVRRESASLVARTHDTLPGEFRAHGTIPDPRPLRVRQRNASVAFGDRYILKSLRRVQSGVNVEVEMGQYLSAHETKPRVPRVLGSIEYCRSKEDPVTIAVLHEYIAHDSSAWGCTLEAIGDFLDDALGQVDHIDELAPPTDDLLSLTESPLPSRVGQLIGPYLELVKLLGHRTAQMHVALAESDGNPAFDPEPFTDFHRRALSHAMDGAVKGALRLLRKRLADLPFDVQDRSRYLLDREDDVRAIARTLRDQRVRAHRIRCHGYYHLRQLLYTGNDLVIIDFEGEPQRRLSERRLKNSPLRDVAGMLRSFHYATNAYLLGKSPEVVVGQDERPWLRPAALFWQQWVSAAFLKSYLATAGTERFLPESREQLNLLLRAYLLDRSVYELVYELENRIDWLRIPLDGIVQLLKTGDGGTPAASV